MKSTKRIATLMATIALCFVSFSTARADCGVNLFGKLPAAALRAPLPPAAMLSSDRDKDDDGGQFGSPIVGLWATTITTSQTVILRGFDVYHSDHTEVLNEFDDPRTGNVCLGVWKYAGHGTYKVKHPAFLWDANGVWIGYRIIRQTVTLDADGDSFSGTWSVDVEDKNGNITGHVDAEIVGTRVTVDY